MANARHSKARRFVQQRLFSGLSAFTELEQTFANLPDEKSRGDALEVFTEAYLATQRKHDAETVWPLASVPIKDELVRESNYDIRQLFENLRAYERAHPDVPRIHGPEDLRRLAHAGPPSVNSD